MKTQDQHISKLYVTCIFIIFLSFTAAGQTSIANDINNNQERQQEYTLYNPDYVQMKRERVEKFRSMKSEVNKKEAEGYDTYCDHQILWEVGALITQTADFKRIDKRFADLGSSLAHPDKMNKALRLDSLSDNWENCFEEWYCQVSALGEELGKEKNRNAHLKYYPHLLDQVNSPEKLSNYLTSVSISDIPKTGTDNLLELNISISSLLRMILRDQPKNYMWDPRLKESIIELLTNDLRNPETGWWGERYIRNGELVYIDDLSTTFHIVSFLKGDVPDMKSVVATTLAVKDLDYPVGWLWNREYWNHNNMDVAELFRLGWKYADKTQKKTISTEIQKMLDWCLNESLQLDGSFKQNIADGSNEEGIYYGASFLSRIGFFDKSKRFWTHQKFANSEEVRLLIINYILNHYQTGGSGGSYYQSALIDNLNYKPGQKNN